MAGRGQMIHLSKVFIVEWINWFNDSSHKKFMNNMDL